MPSKSSVLAFEVPPNQFLTLPCAKCASTSRGCTTPRSRTNARTSFAWARRFRSHARLGSRGVHERLGVAVHVAVVHEEILLDRQLRISPVEVARAVALDAVAEREVLGAGRGRGADRPGRTRGARGRAGASWARRGCGRWRSGGGRPGSARACRAKRTVPRFRPPSRGARCDGSEGNALGSALGSDGVRDRGRARARAPRSHRCTTE
jgi:hypothetical protein